jgi:hypothetical protein
VRISIAGYKIKLPGHPWLRIGLGMVLIGFGLLGFLPVVGFWMIPVGIAILSVDLSRVRRFRRSVTVKFGYWLHRRWPSLARRFGYGVPRDGKLT